MNLFETYDLDPALGLRELTGRLRERIQDAASEPERQLLREAWESLTKNPYARAESALLCAPKTSFVLTSNAQRAPAQDLDANLPPLSLVDFLALPSIAEAWGRAGSTAAVADEALELHADPIWLRFAPGARR
jgi:hypothetical protein